MGPFQPIIEQSFPCKCCPGTASIYGVVDFQRSCHDFKNLPLSGIPIYYHRCVACGFIFTAAFDAFTPEQFREHIYNAQYSMYDPDYATVRPEKLSKTISRLLGPAKSIRILDYGSGNGAFARKMTDFGFTDVSCFDPFVPDSSARPEGAFDLITCFEVVEHSPNPKQIFGEMMSLQKKPGMILFSTLFQPDDIDEQRLNWWYIGPRNGHVSLFSRTSMDTIAGSFGCRLGSFGDGLHVMVDQVPEWAKRFSPKD